MTLNQKVDLQNHIVTIIICGLQCYNAGLLINEPFSCRTKHWNSSYYPKHGPFTADFQGPILRVEGLPGLKFVFWVPSFSRLLSKVTEWHQGQLVVKNALKVHNGLRHQGLLPWSNLSPGTSPRQEVRPPLLWPDFYIDAYDKPFRSAPSENFEPHPLIFGCLDTPGSIL